MSRDEMKVKAEEPIYNQCSSRETVSTTLRHKARRLREHSVALENLADRLDCLGLTGQNEETLWKEIVSKEFH